MASVADVPEGTYNVAISGDLSFTKDGIAGSSKINQKSENVSVKSGNAQVKLAVNTFNAKEVSLSQRFSSRVRLLQKESSILMTSISFFPIILMLHSMQTV